MRPAALMRGARRKAISKLVIGLLAGSSWAAAKSARRPAADWLAQFAQTQRGDDAIFAAQRNRIGDGGDGRHFEKAWQQFVTRAVGVVALEQGLSELQSDRCAAERLLWITAVVLIRIEDGQRNRNSVVRARKMVVGDDEVEAEALRGFGFGKGAHAGVYSDDETNALGICGFKYGRLQSVALAQAMGHVKANLAAEQFDCGLKQDHGGGAVHVVVAVEQDGFLSCDGLLRHALRPSSFPASAADRAIGRLQD